VQASSGDSRLVEREHELVPELWATPSAASSFWSERESPELAAAKRCAAAVALAVRLELVDEALERLAVVEPEAADVERNAEERPDPGLSAGAGDALLDPHERREEPSEPYHVPDTVQLAHG
jgi:hypothetical protein